MSTKILTLWGLSFFLLLSNFSLFAQSADITEGCAPLEVHFAPPAGVTTYYWEFGDAVTSTVSNPVNTFSMPGTYEVVFRESSGGPVVGTVSIYVYELPQIFIVASPLGGCVPLEVNFSDSSIVADEIGINSYTWTFGDSEVGTGEMVSHTYQNQGLYDVSLLLNADKPNCNASVLLEDLISVSSPPNPSFLTNPNPPVACDPPLEVSFINTSPTGNYTYSWDFGAFGTFEGQNPGPITVTTEGFTVVSMTMEDDAGCSQTVSKIVNVGSPIASFSIPDDTMCLGQLYQLVNSSSGGSYAWEFEDGNPLTSTSINPSVRFNQPGPKTIKLTVTSPDGQCSNDTTVTVFVDQVIVNATVAPDYSCFQPLDLNYQANSTNAVEWFWLFGDGTSSNDENPSHQYVDQDTTTHSINGGLFYNTTVIVRSAAGCAASQVVGVEINEPNALFAPSIMEGCAPLEVTFMDLSTSNEDIVSWSWHIGEGSPIVNNTPDDVIHTYNTPGQYNIFLTIENTAGCIDTSYIQTVFVGDALSPSFSVDNTNVCPGDTVQFTDLTNDPNIDAIHYYTDNFKMSHCADDEDPSWAFHDVGTHDVTMEVFYNGCLSTTTIPDLVTVSGPVADIAYQMVCATPFDYEFNSLSTGADSVYWDFGDGQTSTDPMVSHTYAATGDYLVKIRAVNTSSGCADSRDSVMVYVRDIVADFTIPDFVCKGEDLALDASSSQDVNGHCEKGYRWNSSERRPIVIGQPQFPKEFSFSQSGDQWVELIVEDVNGCADTLRDSTRVFEVTATVMASDNFICLPNSVDLSSTYMGDTTLASWEWDFGDGSMATGPTQTHSYDFPAPANNRFTVSIKVTDVLGCEGTGVGFIDIYKPVSNISASPSLFICEGDSITFSASDFTSQGSFLNYDWDFGSVQSNQQTNTIGYPSDGEFGFSLTYTEDATGCTDMISDTVRVQAYPTAGYGIEKDTSVICYPKILYFGDSSVSDYTLTHFWDFGQYGTFTEDSLGLAFNLGTSMGTHIVSTPYGCRDTIDFEFTIDGPSGDFTIQPDPVCFGSPVTVDTLNLVDAGSFSFEFEGIIYDNQSPVSHTFSTIPPNGKHVIKLLLLSEDGACYQPILKEVSMHSTQAAFTNSDGSLTGCEQETFSFINQSTDADQYAWDFGEGGTSTDVNPSHEFSGPGTYDVTLSVTNTTSGCMHMITQPITVNPIAWVVATGNDICEGDTTVLMVTNPNDTWSYSWEPVSLVESPFNATTNATPTDYTEFIVTSDNGTGCIDSDTVPIYVVQEYPNINFDTTIFAGTTISLPVEYAPPYVFSWNPTAGLSCLVCSNPEVTPTEDIIYNLDIDDTANCFTSTGIFNIKIFPEDIDIPNAFTPNNDGNNDHFNIVVTEDVAALMEVTDFRIYNRWGQVVYDNDNPDQGWDGTFKGKELPSDAYPYMVEVTFLNGKKKSLRGNVSLLR